MKALARFGLVLTFLVIAAGGIVRTTQSGMGCPDWPTCFGKWIPPTSADQLPADYEKYLRVQDIDHTFNAYHTWIEYINRLFGVLLGIFGLIQFYFAFKRKSTDRRAFKLAFAFLAIVILTGLFGAIVVKMNLAHASVSVHLLFAIILLQIQAAIVMHFTGKLFKRTAGHAARNLILAVLVIIFIHSVFGTMVRMHVDDVSKALLYQQREAWLSDDPMIFLIHRTFSWLVLAAVVFLSYKLRKIQALTRPVAVLMFIVLMSMITGITMYYLDMPPAMQPLHLLLASAAITQCLYLWLHTKNISEIVKEDDRFRAAHRNAIT